jgi:hypothetical protein
MQTKESNFATVFSIMNGRILSDPDEILLVIEFMTGKRFSVVQMVEGMILCKPKLIEKFPLISVTVSETALEKLDSALNKDDVRLSVDQITITWLKQQEASCPYKDFDVPRIKEKKSAHEHFLDKKIELGF